MKQIWHKKEREPRRGEDLDLVFKSTDGTYFVDTTTAPISSNFYYDDIKEWCYAEDLVEQVERLQEQLNEANNIIVKADWDCDYTLQSKCGFGDYLKKYDVKGMK